MYGMPHRYPSNTAMNGDDFFSEEEFGEYAD
jgi:hypothetical protein